MARFVKVVLLGLLVGLAARGLMRVAALVGGTQPGFEVAESAMIVGLFVLLGVVGLVAGTVANRHRVTGWIVSLLAVPLLIPGFSIGIVEVTEKAGTTGAGVLVVVIASLILVGYVAMPIVGWRTGRGVAAIS